jgi:hypothetical protein
MYVFVLVAAAATLYFACAAFQRPRLGVIVAAIVWLLYAVYEYYVASGVLCDANCNIRVDVILIWPLMWIATLFGIYAPGQWTLGGKVLGGLSAFLLASMTAVALYITFVETPAAERAAQPAAASDGSAPSAK